MGRAILAVIVSYVVLAVFVFVVFSGVWMALGVEGAFKEGSYEVSGTWIAQSLVVGLVAALLAGFLCSRIAPRPGPLYALCALIALGGILSLMAALGKEPPGPRAEDVGMFDAMSKAVTPVWVAVLNPVIGIVGVLLGGRGATKKPSS